MGRCLVFTLCLAYVHATTDSKPNILHILLDDYGWADASWHRPEGYKDVQTPNMDGLLKEGVELDRHYVFKFCSPSRSAIQSGRNPIHVNAINIDVTYPGMGVAKEMTGMAEHMVKGGYQTAMVGKWDAGMATPKHTPHGRGYQKSLHYFHHSNDYWTFEQESCGKKKIKDLWDTTAPAKGLANPGHCSQSSQTGCKYEDKLFTERVIDTIEGRDKSKPFFIFWAPHSVHVPLQVPDAYLHRFSFIKDKDRQFYNSMVYFVDEAIGNVTKTLKAEGVWDNTLIIVHADNGGPIYSDGHAGGNNYPLKGGKLANWEGGIRVNAFASGGFLPEAVRGTKNEGLMAGWDWYATFAALAGVDPTDTSGAAAGLPPIDSHNLWPLLSGQTKSSPRTELAIGDYEDNTKPHSGMNPKAKTLVGGLISGKYKVIVGTVSQAGWPGPQFPDTPCKECSSIEECGQTVDTGCMFDIFSDPGEHKNIAKENADVFNEMIARINTLQKTAYSPDRGSEDKRACEMATGKYGGFWGPYIDVDMNISHEVLV